MRKRLEIRSDYSFGAISHKGSRNATPVVVSCHAYCQSIRGVRPRPYFKNSPRLAVILRTNPVQSGVAMSQMIPQLLPELFALCGHEIGVSEWKMINQETIDQFSMLTG